MPILYSYWRSSASYRVRIGLALKGIRFETVPVSLIDGEQAGADYASINPQKVLPALRLDDGRVLTQSLAILEYLDEAFPQHPLLPADPFERAKVRAFSAVIASDTHPIQNLSVLKYLRASFDQDDDGVAVWARHWIGRGLETLEPIAAASEGDFIFGDEPGLAEVCLIPQLYNAARFKVELDRFPALVAIDAACAELPAFRSAAPQTQPDTP